MYVINKQIIANAFGVYQSGYVEDPKVQVTKLLVKELLFSRDIKPYTNAYQWNVKKCKMSINIRYPFIIYVVY